MMSVITVTNTADSGPGSLRAALMAANATHNAVIAFDIAGEDTTIRPLSPLPLLRKPVTIDGTTQGGYRGEPVIEIDGGTGDNLTSGFLIKSPDCTLRGLSIYGFKLCGIVVMADRARISGNFIGTDRRHIPARGNGHCGIVVKSADCIIGGHTPAERNIISSNEMYGVAFYGANATRNRVVGNFIGTDKTGMHPLGNKRTGVIMFNAPGNVIGGIEAGAGNVISGNLRNGVNIDGAATRNEVKTYGDILDDVHGGVGQARDNIVIGNLIGTDATGLNALGNRLHGVLLFMARHNIIGGQARNIISGNAGNGVAIMGPNPCGPDWRRYIRNSIDGKLYQTVEDTPDNCEVERNIVQGNYIGTCIHGTTRIGNKKSGVLIVHASRNLVGGATRSTQNVISGNGGHGVHIMGETSDGNRVTGNAIGTNATGTEKCANNVNGVMLSDAVNTVVGGFNDNDKNVISGNRRFGVLVKSACAATDTAHNRFIMPLYGSLRLQNGKHAHHRIPVKANNA